MLKGVKNINQLFKKIYILFMCKNFNPQYICYMELQVNHRTIST